LKASTVAAKPKSRRKPRSQAQRASATSDSIMSAATELFLSQGYANTNLEQIATLAGVTKPTVYSHFGSKEKLLRTITDRSAQQRVSTLTGKLTPSDNPRADLVCFGNAFLSVVLSDQGSKWERLAASESVDHPEVGAAFYQAGPARVIELLRVYLLAQKRAGRLTIPNPARAAEHLLGLFLGLELLRNRIGHAPKSAAELKRHCRECVDLFVRAHGGSPS